MRKIVEVLKDKKGVLLKGAVLIGGAITTAYLADAFRAEDEIELKLYTEDDYDEDEIIEGEFELIKEDEENTEEE